MHGVAWTKETFFGNTIRDGPDSCWIWRGAKSRVGNGKHTLRNLRPYTSLNGKFMSANKAAWILAHGKPPHKQLNHSCNIGLCVRPDHMYDGTQKQNVMDRQNLTGKNPAETRYKKEVSYHRSVHQWRNDNIRDLHGKFTSKEIASMFGICENLVFRIWQGSR